MTRRQSVRQLAAWMAASSLARAQTIEHAKIDQMVNVFDFDPIFRSRATKPAYDYVTGGSWDEWTLARNREAFGSITFRPRMLVQVDKLDTSIQLFGQKLDMPILVAPTGTHSLIHPEGEVATIRGAGAAGAVTVVSTSTSVPLKQVR